ncbi:MAG: PfaD family polyunsaturated fatty acid/polyketide biosynthesis protein [Deltaproteobacteria bacterium]|nr:PfaD family polyunsaturated fatty acid/polyketide biosynthesis protein [Deltaproteobacteria bacterium]
MGDDVAAGEHGLAIRAFVPALKPEQLGDAAFRSAHGVRYAYIAGEMANGIASAEIVEAMGHAGMLGFFGAAGLSPAQVEAAIVRIQKNLGQRPYGFNLIHSPNEPALEAELVELYLRYGVKLVCASAYLDLTLPVVRYRTAGIHRGPGGEIVAPNQLIAKVSRVEVARKFLSPAPERFLKQLMTSGHLTAEQASLAGQIPLAEDLTAEADSGGHTDNRPAITLIPTMLALRDEVQAQYDYARAPRIGAAGGIATPASAAAAFAMGAAYVLTGSINQSCVEAGISPVVKEMLAQSGQADVIMAPAADMFEMGVKVQVLKHGTLFAMRGRRLYDIYREYGSLEAIPANVRQGLERDFFRTTLEDAWVKTRSYFETRDRAQIEKAERDPKHKMALVFRSYLGQTSRWAIAGEESRKIDYQVWCGPAMGAFNEWVKGSFLEPARARAVVPVALNIMYGAAVLARIATLRAQDGSGTQTCRVPPVELNQLHERMN